VSPPMTNRCCRSRRCHALRCIWNVSPCWLLAVVHSDMPRLFLRTLQRVWQVTQRTATLLETKPTPLALLTPRCRSPHEFGMSCAEAGAGGCAKSERLCSSVTCFVSCSCGRVGLARWQELQVDIKSNVCAVCVAMLLTACRPCPKCKTVCFRDRDCPQMYAAFGFFFQTAHP
jgi:hypothetical protein